MTHSIWDFSVLVEKGLQRCWGHLNFQTRCSSRTAAQLVHSLLAARVQIKPSLTHLRRLQGHGCPALPCTRLQLDRRANSIFVTCFISESVHGYSLGASKTVQSLYSALGAVFPF